MKGIRLTRLGVLLLAAVGIGFGASAVGTADDVEYLRLRKQMISEGRTIPDDPPRKIVIAAANSSRSDRLAADLVCTGTNDEAVINRAIAMLTRGGTLQLLDGAYRIDAFPGEDNSAICFGFNNGEARTINFVGTTENKAYNTTFGVTLHVTERALQTIVPGRTFRVFYGTPRKPPSRGAFFTYTHVNNVNFENFHLYFHDASKPLIGIDCRNFGSSYMKLVGIYTERYFEDRFMHVRPATPASGTIGLVTMPSANDEISRIGFDTVQIGGLHTGFLFNGVEHLILQTCGACRCCYGFVFRGGSKTLTLINCADEGNTHLPKFVGRGQITMLDFCIERLNAAFIPLDPDGNDEHYAVEEVPGGWQGSLNYTLQGPAFGLDGFWKLGHGAGMVTTRLGGPKASRPKGRPNPTVPADMAFRSRVDGTEQRFVVIRPEKLPDHPDVLIALHGHGSDRWQFIKDSRGECAAARDVAAARKMLYVSPDYRAKTSWMGPAAEADILQIIQELKRRFGIGRVFLCGGSMGGTGALTFTVLHPDVVAGVTAFNPLADHLSYDRFQDAIEDSFGVKKADNPQLFRQRSALYHPESFKDIPLAITVGGKDPTIPPDSARKLYAEVLKFGTGKVYLDDKPERGHKTDYASSRKALEWMFSAISAQ